MENTRPASDPLPEWENSKLHEISTLVAGHLLDAQGIASEVVDDYKELVEPYTVDIEAIIKGEENNE